MMTRRRVLMARQDAERHTLRYGALERWADPAAPFLSST